VLAWVKAGGGFVYAGLSIRHVMADCGVASWRNHQNRSCERLTTSASPSEISETSSVKSPTSLTPAGCTFIAQESRANKRWLASYSHAGSQPHSPSQRRAKAPCARDSEALPQRIRTRSTLCPPACIEAVGLTTGRASSSLRISIRPPPSRPRRISTYSGYRRQTVAPRPSALHRP
jgi:hypothetical protein